MHIRQLKISISSYAQIHIYNFLLHFNSSVVCMQSEFITTMSTPATTFSVRTETNRQRPRGWTDSDGASIIITP